MNASGYTLEKIVDCLRRHDGQLSLKAVLNNCRLKRLELELELEKAACPLKLRFEYNGGPVPKEMLVLKDPGWSPPVVSQQEAAARLNAMSNDQWLNLLDPTRPLRLRNKRGHRRTSTGADEYFGTNGG